MDGNLTMKTLLLWLPTGQERWPVWDGTTDHDAEALARDNHALCWCWEEDFDLENAR